MRINQSSKFNVNYAANNLFRHNEFNANKEASPGFFEDNGSY